MNVQDFPHQLVHFRGAPGQLVLQLVQERSTTVVRPVQEHGKRVSTHLYGQEVNNETYAICKADMLLKGERNVDDNILGGPQHSTLSNDAFRPPRFATGSYIQFEEQHHEVDQTARDSISQLRGRWIR